MSNATPSKRKWAPKSKGGCSTCKSRRIRCDDHHPRCTPCQKSSRQCEYSANPDRDPLKIVLWQPDNLVFRQVSQNPWHTSDEVRAFDFFRTEVAPNLSGFFDSRFWTHDILQVAQQEETIRHAIVALASVSEGMLKSSPGSVKVFFEPFAIRQYTKAISDLRQRMQGDESSAEVVLITCALFICIEMFQNHHESALSHMSSGIYVFYNWRSNQERETYQSSLISPKNLSKLDMQLDCIFGRLMLQMILFIDTSPSEWKFVTPAFTPAVPLIPSVFRSIGEARDSLNSCTCALYHRMLASQFHGVEDHGFDELSAAQLGANPLNQWLLSFKSFTIDVEGSLSLREQKAAILLQIQHITACILASTGPSTEETRFDLFEQEFSQIIALASRLLAPEFCESPPDSEQSSIPAFDMGILPQLYFVASRCRHPIIRRQALHLLRRGPGQEGIWHREMLANIAKRIMELEEVDCRGASRSEDIPASVRLSVINAKIDSAKRTVTLHCCRQQVGEGETNVIHELVEY